MLFDSFQNKEYFNNDEELWNIAKTILSNVSAAPDDIIGNEKYKKITVCM